MSTSKIRVIYAFLCFFRGGLGLPDPRLLFERKFRRGQDRLSKATSARFLKLIDWPEPDGAAPKDIIDFESKVAEASWTKTQQRDPVAIYNPNEPAGAGKARPPVSRGRNSWRMPRCRILRASSSRKKSAFSPNWRTFTTRHRLKPSRPWHAFSSRGQRGGLISRSHSPTLTSSCITRRSRGKKEEQGAVETRHHPAVSGGDFGVGDRFGTFGTMGFGVGQLYTAKIFSAGSQGQDRGVGHET